MTNGDDRSVPGPPRLRRSHLAGTTPRDHTDEPLQLFCENFAAGLVSSIRSAPAPVGVAARPDTAGPHLERRADALSQERVVRVNDELRESPTAAR